MLYRIDKEQSYRDDALVIRIEPPISAQTLRKMGVEALIAEEIRFQKNRTGCSVKETDMSFQLVHILFPRALDVLMLLSNVYFQQKRLVIDAYGRSKFFFKVSVDTENKLLVSGHVKSGEKEFPITDCDFICGHFFIKGVSLQFFEEEVPKQAYQGNMTIQDLQEDEEIPFEIIFSGNAKELMKQSSQPLPVLMLKDRMGAFADLWMDYGNGKRIPIQDTKPGKRDRKTELSWEKDLLETDFTKKAMATSHYYCPLDKVSKSLLFLLELGWQVFDMKGNRVMHQGKSDLSLVSQQENILVKGRVHYGNFTADISDVVGTFNRRERFVQLASGVVGLLSQTDLNGIEEGEIVAEGVRIKRNSIGTLEPLFETASLDSSLTAMREKLSSFQGMPTVVPGPGFIGELRPYQKEGLNWLSFLYEFAFSGILADDMGLGKTVQVLAFLSQIELTGPILVVMPTSLIFNWQREIERFFPSVAVYKHHGPDRTQLPSNGIILTSYTTLRMDLPLFNKSFFQCIILDEAQAIKNPNTQTSQAVFSLKAKFRLSITGTPIENHLSELWSHFNFLMPDLLGKEKDFLADIQSGGVDPRFLQKIKRKIRPFVLRRTKKEVAKDLPERIEQVVWVEMAPSQRKVYDDFLAGVQGNLFKKVTVDGISKHRMEVFEAILRLRQICCHPLLVTSQIDHDQDFSSGKLDALLEDIETAVEEGRKVLVYSQFTSMLGVISKEVKARGWNSVYLDGSTVDREKVVMQFQNDASIPLFLISLKAGGIGLNLTAADYVFLYDPWWNEAVENQAIDRAHRIGRHDTVIAKRYVAVESIEEKMMKLKESKRMLIDDLLDSDLATPQLSEEDFRFLLSV